MPCLYCGKELALLKRLRGGGEFCSEAHRLRYREEYDELALNRLLQAKQPEESARKDSPAVALAGNTGASAPPAPAAPGTLSNTALSNTALSNTALKTALNTAPNGAKPAHAPPPAEAPAKPGAFAMPAASSPAVAEGPQRTSPKQSPKQEPPQNKEPEVKPPAPPAGYLLPRIDAARFDEAETRPALPESAPAILPVPAPAFPSRGAAAAADAEGSLWKLAGQVEIRSFAAADAVHTPRGKNVEIREFVRAFPFTPVALGVAGVTMLGTADIPVEVDLLPYGPAEPAPWLAPAREFAAAESELGAFARLLFRTTGFENTDETATPVSISTGPALAKLTRPSAAHVPKSTAAVYVEPVVVKFVGGRTRESEEPAQAPSTPAPENAIAQARAEIPARLVKALTVPAPAIQAGRGRPVQIFSTPLVPSAVPKAPPFAAKPMRPKMVFGTSPSPLVPVVVEPVAMQKAASLERAAEKLERAAEKLERAADKDRGAERPGPASRASLSPQGASSGRNVGYKSAFLIPTDVEKPATVRTPGDRKQSRPAFPKAGEQDLKAPAKPSPPSPFVTPSSLKSLKQEAKREETAGKEPASPFLKVKAGESPKRIDKPAAAKDSKVADAKAAEPKPELQSPEAKTAEARGIEAKSIEGKSPEAKSAEGKSNDAKPAEAAHHKPKPAPEPEFDLGLPTLNLEEKQGFWTRLPMGARIGLAAGVIVALGLAIYLSSGGAPATAKSAPVAVEQGPQVRPGAPIMDAQWLADWAPDTNIRRNRRISILKTSAVLTDYRVQFEAQIENKAIAWIYRAADPKNYYVTKIEVIRPGLEPGIALTRFALVNGVETPRTQTPLDLKVRVDTIYKVRFEAVGNQFTTWIQDRKVDQWTDSRFTSGGPGLYSEQGESEALRGTVNVIPLIVVQNPSANRAGQKQ